MAVATMGIAEAPEPSDIFALEISALAAHLSMHGMALDEDFGARRLSGGLSNLNYLIRVDGIERVLRRPPAGDLPPGAHDMAREHQVLSRLSTVFSPAPESLHLCTDKAVIGAPFQILEFRTGLVVRGDTLPKAFATQESRAALADELVRTLAALHAVDAAAIGLGQFGKPDGFFGRNVEGWLKRGDLMATEQREEAALKQIGDWLRAQAPKPSAPTLLHSDFKLDNCMLDHDGRITTVLDWDMGTRGDPLMDLATMLSYWSEPGDPDCMHKLAQMPTAAAGFPSRSAVAAAYAVTTGRDLSDFHAWRILAMLKLGVVFLQLHSNWARGIAGDESYAGFADLGRDLLDFTQDSLGADAMRHVARS